jgi:hypothetical protein
MSMQQAPLPSAPETPAAADRLELALALSRRGFAVFPLRPGSKVPAVRGDWEGVAIADPQRLRRAGWPPGGNIAVACGPSGLFVLDLDVPKDPATGEGAARVTIAGSEAAGASGSGNVDRPRDGATALGALAAGRPIPRTFTVATPSGGTHLYFRAPSGLWLRNTVGRLGPLIDTRGIGGYVVAPGSVIRGRRYEIVDDAPIAPVPRWIVRELNARAHAVLPPSPPFGRPAIAGPRPPGSGALAYGAAALRNETERVLAAPVGTRNDTLNRAAYALGRLVGAGIVDREVAATELFRAARRAGLPARECASTLASGLGAGMARPRFPARIRVGALTTAARRPLPPAGSTLLQNAYPPVVQQQSRRDAAPPLAAMAQALRDVDRAYDAAALCAAPLVANRDWRRVRALADALRDLRDSPRPQESDLRRAQALCESLAGLAGALARDFPAPGRKRARSPLGNALLALAREAGAAARAATAPNLAA